MTSDISRIAYTFVHKFATPFASQIANIMVQEWGYNYIAGFGYTSQDEYKLWKDDTIFLVASREPSEFIGMVAFERYNIAMNSRFTPCLCCLYVEPSWRSKGIGQELMRLMFEYVKKQGYKEIFAWTLDTTLSRWLESNAWRYETDAIYLNRRITVLRANLDA